MSQQAFGQQHGQSFGGNYGPQGGQDGMGHTSGGYGQSPYDHGAFGAGSQQGYASQQGYGGRNDGGGHDSRYGFNAHAGQGGQMGGQYGGQPSWGRGGYNGQQMSGQQRSDVHFNPQTMDKDYNLISVLYHALQAADVCAQYCEDARREGSPEVAAFLDQTRQQNLQISQRAKELLFRQRQI